MKEVEKKHIPDVSGGCIDGEVIPAIDPDYPQNPIGPIVGPIVGPTCPPFPQPDQFRY